MANYNYRDEGEGYNPRKDNPAAAKPAAKPVKMSGSPKQVAWAEKIIASKTKGAKTAGIRDEEWQATVKYITEKYGARGWIDMRDDHPASILHTMPRAAPAPAKAAEPTPAKTAASTADMVAKAVEQGIDPEVARKAGQLQDAIATVTDTDAKRRIRTLVMPLARDAGAAAKSGNVKQAHNLLDMAGEALQEISASSKPIAAKQILRSKAQEAGIPATDWATAEKIITKIGGDQMWNTLQTADPRVVARAALIAEMPEIEAKSEKQREYAESMRLRAVLDLESRYPRQANDAKKYGMLGKKMITPVEGADRETGIRALIRGMGTTYVDARNWIDYDVADLANDEDVRAGLTAAKPAAEPALRPVLQPSNEIAARIAAAKQRVAAIGSPAATADIEQLLERAEQAGEARARSLLKRAEGLLENFPDAPAETPSQQAQGITPEVMSKASELQDALAKVPAEEAQRLKRLINPIARDASQLAQAGDTQGAIRLLDQALEDVRSYTPPAPPTPPAPKVFAPPYRDEAPYDPRRDIPQRGVEQAFSRKMGKGVAYLKAQGAVSAPTRRPEPEPNWATLSAKEIAGKYADEMAQIVISAGETITAGLFEDAGAEFAANAAARNAGDLLRRRATQWTANHAQDIAETLAQAAETSASPHSIVEELATEYVEHAETVARTEMARVREEANLDIMRAQGAEKVQFIASEDERLCPVCGAHHGKVYDVHDAPVLPLHPNCRCTLVPYIDDEEVIMSP